MKQQTLKAILPLIFNCDYPKQQQKHFFEYTCHPDGYAKMSALLQIDSFITAGASI
jgi:hypothetical protein